MRHQLLWVLTAVITGNAFALDIPGLQRLTPYGSFEYLGQQAQNEQDFDRAQNDQRGNTVTRVRLGLNATFSDTLRGRVEFVRAPKDAGGTNPDAQFGGNPRDLNAELSHFFVQNAYLELDHVLGLDQVRVGRQYLGRPGDLLVYYGPLNDNVLSVRSLQGVSAKKQIGPVQVHVAAATPFDDDPIPQRETAGNPSTDKDDIPDAGDVSIVYGYVNSDRLLQIPAGKVDLELGFYQGVDKQSSASNDSNQLQIYDARARYAVPFRGEDTLIFSVETAVNGGADRGPVYDSSFIMVSSGAARPYKGHATVVKATYDWRNLVQVHGLIANASGDGDLGDKNIKAFRDFTSLGATVGSPNSGFPGSDFRYGKIFHDSANLGFDAGLDSSHYGDVGLHLYNLGVESTPPFLEKKLTFTADYFRARTSVLRSGSNKKLMEEIDWALRYEHSEQVSVVIGHARLHAFDQLRIARETALATSLSGGDAITLTYINLNVRFGLPPEPPTY